VSTDPTRPLPEWHRPPEWQQPQGPQEPPTFVVRKRRRRGPLIALITVLVILVLLVVSDRVANAYAENRMASQVQSSLGLSGKPDVTIHGFPFWTQLIARDFKNVTVTASNETINSASSGGGALEIASLNATLHGLHFQSYSSNSATVDQFNATALVTFTALANIGGVPQGVTLTADGPNQVKATLSLGPLSASATAQVTQSGPNQIHVHVTDFGGIPADQLGNFGDFTVSIPNLPAGVTIKSVSVTQQGVMVTIAGQNTTLSQNS
jgi:LmeA-like phospholipid-binding